MLEIDLSVKAVMEHLRELNDFIDSDQFSF